MLDLRMLKREVTLREITLNGKIFKNTTKIGGKQKASEKPWRRLAKVKAATNAGSAHAQKGGNSKKDVNKGDKCKWQIF